MLNVLKTFAFYSLLIGPVIYGYNFLSEKVLIVTKPPRLVLSSPQDYLVNLYARYQLHPDTDHLIFGLKLLSNANLTEKQHSVVKNIINDIEKQPRYSERDLINKIEEIKIIKHEEIQNFSFIGLNLSSFIKVDESRALHAKNLINEMKASVYMHDSSRLMSDIEKLSNSNLVSNPSKLASLKEYNFKLPNLSWNNWIMELR